MAFMTASDTLRLTGYTPAQATELIGSLDLPPQKDKRIGQDEDKKRRPIRSSDNSKAPAPKAAPSVNLAQVQLDAEAATMNELTRQFEENTKRHNEAQRTDSHFAVSKIIYCENTGLPQVLSYDIRKLVTYGGILNMFSRGTIFRDQYALKWYFLVHFGGLAFCIAVVILCGSGIFGGLALSDYKDMSTDKVEKLASSLNFMVPLVLGLYLALALERWWTLRVDAIGRLVDCALDIAQQVAAYLPDESQVIEDVNRWALASVDLLMKAAREEHDLNAIVKAGRLHQSEADGLEGIALYGRSMVMWAWIARISNEAMLQCKGPEPHSNHLYVMLDCCMKARRSIQTIHTYLLTPMPFAYVHTITVLVDALVFVLSMKCSLVCVKAFHQESINYQNIMYEMITWVLLPLLYHGLMSVTYVIRDPFGDDMADLPISTYQRWSKDHLDAVVLGNENFPWREWESLSGMPQSPESKAAAGMPVHSRLNEDLDEDRAGVAEVAGRAACAVMKDATIEVTVHVKRALRGFNAEMTTLHEIIERTSERRSKDMEFLLAKLEAR